MKFDKYNLYHKPLIQMRNSHKAAFPSHFQPLHNSQLWSYMENGLIEKIVAMRTYANINIIVLKIKPIDCNEFVSGVIKNPELRILKAIWDCQQPGFNFAIKYYLLHSTNASMQWIHKTEQNKDCFDWYKEITMGNDE